MPKLLHALIRAVALFAAIFAFAGEPPSVRIMPLGDSNTLGYSVPTYFSGYRDLLQALLTDAGYNVDFVGTLVDAQNGAIPDPDHEGHSGFRIDQIATNLNGWLDRIDDPDVVLLMIGTNDFLQNHQTAQASTRLENLVVQLANARPHATILLANIVPNTTNPSVDAAQNTFNATIPGIADRQSSLGRLVRFVDVRQGFTPADMSSDGIHPNENGYDKLAGNWFDAIATATTPLGNAEPPQLARVEPADFTHVVVTFSKPVADDANSLANYQIDGGASIMAATLDAETKRSVTLTTTPLTPGASYTLSVSGVRDRTPAQHLIPAGAQLSFIPPLLANGSFEHGYTAWTATGNQNLAGDAIYVPSHRRRLVAFNTGQTIPNGTLSQSFATEPGQSYRVRFSLGVYSFNFNQQQMQFSVEGSGILLSQLLVLSGKFGGVLTWTPQEFVFTANSTATTLRFTDVSTTSNSIDLLLDDVRVEPAGVTRSLTVQSSPGGGFVINVTPADVNGAGAGTTNFTRTYADGTEVTLTAPAIANGASFQQWLRNGVAYTSATTAAAALDANYSFTAVYSANAPVITSEPQPITAALGESATFSVSATPHTATYQWRHDGNVIPGATDATYTRTNLTAQDAGHYSVVVTNAGSSIASSAALLSIATSQVLANGSFENDAEAWTTAGNVVAYGAAPYAPTDGQKLIVFNGGQSTPNAVLSQRFTTVPGTTYLLRFDYGALSFNTQQQRLNVTIQGNATLHSETFTVTGPGNGATRWLSAMLSFTADSSVTRLQFSDQSTTTQNIDLVLDRVHLTVPTTRTLNVDTTASSPVTIAVSPADQSGQTGDTAPFSRTYLDGAAVTLQAPTFAGSEIFEKWQLDGSDLAFTPTVTVTLSANRTLTAIYSPPPPVGAFANGSFEAGYSSWTFSGNHSLVTSAPYTPTQGSTLVVFNGGQTTPNGVLTQTFTTVPGVAYAIEFDLGVLAYNKNEQRLQVTVSGLTSLLSQTSSVTGLGGGATRWTPVTMSFIADSETSTVTFRDVSPTTANLDLLLDHIRITAPPPRTLEVTSSPDIAAEVEIDVADRAGLAGGTTSFTRSYNHGATITLTAAPTGDHAVFYKWQLNGEDYSYARSISVSMTADRSAHAVYLAPPDGESFTNGGFESGYFGWTATGHQALMNSAPYLPTEGAHVLAFNSGQAAPNGELTQTFNTVVGQTYTVAFDVGVLAYNTHEQRLRVMAQGNTERLAQTISIFGLGGGATRWTSASYQFVADSTTTTLTFRDISPTSANLDLLLDNIRVTP